MNSQGRIIPDNNSVSFEQARIKELEALLQHSQTADLHRDRAISKLQQEVRQYKTQVVHLEAENDILHERIDVLEADLADAEEELDAYNND